MQLGGSMFSTFVVILAGASVFFIPLYAGVRVAAERQENNPDLLYVSTLSPARIICGKFLCSAYMALLFFSACMPFMAFTNLLRGVDLPTVFFILFFLFLVVCAANMVAIFLACLPMSRPFKFLFVIYGFFQSFSVIVPLIGASFTMMRSGVGAMMTGRDFWIGTATAVGVGLMLAGLFFVLSVALISPPSANRALPVRIYITAVWLLGGLLSLSWVMQTGEADRMFAWTYPTFGLMMFALLVTISNSDQISQRVRRTIPQSGIKTRAGLCFFQRRGGRPDLGGGHSDRNLSVDRTNHPGISQKRDSDQRNRTLVRHHHGLCFCLFAHGVVYSPQIFVQTSAEARRAARGLAGRRVGHRAEHRAVFPEPAFVEIRRRPATRQRLQRVFHAR